MKRSLLTLVPLALVLAIAPSVVFAQASRVEMPANAHAKSYGDGWECDRGFRNVAQACVAVKLPANAHTDTSGDGWECRRGYRRVDKV
jgi:hypothetical protein